MHARHLVQRRWFRLEMKLVNIPPRPADPADNVWGLLSKERSESLLKSQKKLLSVIDKGNIGSIKDQLSARGYDQKLFEEGCQIAYRRVAEIYEQGDSVFEDEHLDIMENRLAMQLDQQLADFRIQNKLPRLSLESVDAKILCLLPVPKKPPTHLLPTIINILFGGARWAPAINHFISVGLHFMHPDWNELLVAVEFTSRERFELIPKEDAVSDPARSYVKEFIQKQKRSEQQELVTVINSLRGSVSNVEERKHLFIFAADLSVQAEALEKGTEADTLEFKLRSMGLPVQLPRGVEFQPDDDESLNKQR